MSKEPFNITPDLISDYVADKLDDEDARVVEEAIEHNAEIASAVVAARQIGARMTRSFATAMRLKRVEGLHRLVTGASSDRHSIA